MGIYYVRRTKMQCFECNYGEVGKRRSCVLGFPNDFVFVRPIMLLLFFTISHCHSFLFCKERVNSVSYSRLLQSHNKDTEQDTIPCSGVSSKNKEKNKLTFLFLFFFSVVTLNQAQQKSNLRSANLDF